MAGTGVVTRIVIPIAVGVILLVLLIYFVRVVMRRTPVRGVGMPPMEPVAELPPPARARLERALAKGAIGVNLAQLEAAAPEHAFEPKSGTGAEGDVDLENGDADGEDGNTCTICLEEMAPGARVRTLRCRHTFCLNCVDAWVMRANRCPVCQLPPVQDSILDPDNTATQEQNTSRAGRVRRQRGEDGRFTLARGPLDTLPASASPK